MQGWSLERKVQVTQTRILEWYLKYGGQVFVSFSGGKDSTVLLDIARRVYPDIPAVFVDTGLEYPELREFVKTKENVEWLRPRYPFPQIIEKYGYPVISKEIADCVDGARKGQATRIERLNGTLLAPDGSRSVYNCENYRYLLDAPFKISARCCYHMKKAPVYRYERQTGRHCIVGVMAQESRLRMQKWLQYGCNGFERKRPMSQPLAFWREQDILEYLKRTGISYCSIYGKIEETKKKDGSLTLRTTGVSRSGCMYCMFGVHLEQEPNRFQRMQLTHPRQYDYCINHLGCGRVLDFIGVPYRLGDTKKKRDKERGMKMERNEIYALAKLGANRYRLRKLYLPREEIQGIRQQEGTGYDGLRSLFEGLPVTGDAWDGRMSFILPDSCGGLCVRTKDMGPDFPQRNQYNGASMEGTREEMMAQLRDGLREQGYHFRPNACFQDVDVLETLRKIMEHNTSFNQTDFRYDREMLLEAAGDRDAPRNFFWMSRDGGTWCFPERGVHIQQTSQWNTWLFYGGCRSDHVKAFWVHLDGMYGGRVAGDILEMDYQKHLDYLCTHSHEPERAEVAFKGPAGTRIFGYQEFDQNWPSITERYGATERIRYLVGDEAQLARDMAEARRMFWDAVEPMDIDSYVARLDHDRLHDYGYTAGDMGLTGPVDAELAVRQGLECYILEPDGSRELACSHAAYQEALSHGKLFGMAAGEKEILRYLKQDAVPLFNKEEMWEIYSLALQAGMEDGAGESGLLDSIIHKAECFLPGAEEREEDIQGEEALPGDVAR